MPESPDRKLFLHLSNRFEDLAIQLAGDLASRGGDPLAMETVVVSSTGTARWLSMQIASQGGIAMGVRYPFSRAIIDELTAAVLGGQATSRRFSRDSMTWWIFDQIASCLDRPEFSMVRDYLDGGDALKRYQLASRVAALLDQYQVYRPEMLRGWEAQPHSGGWQSHIWRSLRSELIDELSFVDLHEKILAMDDEAVAAAALPPHLRVFGLNTMPPSFLQILWKISVVTQVDFYLLAPTDQYWGDLVSNKKQLQTEDPDTLPESNPLVASLGRLSRDLLKQLVELDFQQASERFEPDPDDTMLGSIHEDFRALSDRTQADDKLMVREDDTSIQIHSCHSPMREVEVLHDHLLALFQEDPSLRARDVLVMAPDINRYAPFVDAVFGAPEREALRVPYSVADQSPRSEFAVVDAFLRVLELATSRFEAGPVMGVLECEPIRRRFGLDETDLGRIRRWILDCGIVWALDPAHRKRLGFPADALYTWAHGQATLLDGYAMNGIGPRLRGPVLPYEEMEGDHVETLGRFLAAFEVFCSVASLLQDSRRRAEWEVVLQGIATSLFADDPEFAIDLRAIQGVLASLSTDDFGDASPPVDPEVILVSLNQALEEVTSGGGFLDGRVTFCSLKPLRAIPSPVVCLLGMNDSDFPRLPSELAFDLMASDPRPGDRSVRNDDRHLLFETIMGARRQLYVSFQSQSQRDLAAAPPSVVVSELLDYIDRGFRVPEPVRERLNRRHRLQAFSRVYFEPGPLQSFSSANAEAARNLTRDPEAMPPFFPTSLPEPEQQLRTVSPSQLAEFFVHPTRRICESRLGIQVDRGSDILPAHEPIQLDGLERYEIQQVLVDSILRNDGGLIWDAARARGRLPSGPFGTVAESTVNQVVGQFVRAVRDRIQFDNVETVAVRKQVGNFEVVGEIDGVYDGILGRFRCATLKSSDLVRAWVLHVLLNLERPGSKTIILDREIGERALRPPENPEQIVAGFLDLYWRGLSEPLRLFPRSSLEFEAYRSGFKQGKKGTTTTPIARATAVWRGNPFSPMPGEGEDPFLQLVFGEEPPFDESFENDSKAFFEPLLGHLEGKLP